MKPEARRPSGKRPAPSRYQPPQPDAFDSEPKSSGTRLPDSDPIPFGFFNAQEKEPSPSEDRLDSDELPLPATLKPSGKQTTTTPEPAPSSDESEERKPSTLFPPFNKRARPTASTAAPKTTTESVERSKPSPSDKESAPVLPRITSYKQRIEAMKERVRLQQQQQHQAQSKKDDDVVAEPVDVKPSTTSTTTTRKPTTRAKFPTRMPTKKAITEASSTTESAADFPIEKGLPTFDESRRRFKPKNSYSRKPEIKEEPAESDPSSDALEENLKKDVLPKLSDHPYRRKQQQKDRVQLEDMKPAEPPIRPPSKDPSKRRPNFSRTTSRPLVDDDDEEPTPASRPSIKKPIKTLVDSNRDVETSDDEPVIELIEVSSDDNQSDKQPKPLAESSEHDEVKPVQVAEHFEPTQEPFVEKPARSDEEDEPVEERVTSSGSGNVRERLPIFTMATNDPMLPIEELLNIRIRDDGKGM